MTSKEMLEVLTELLRELGRCPLDPTRIWNVQLELLSSRAAKAAAQRGKITGAYLPPHAGEGGKSRGEQAHRPVDYQHSQFAFQH